MSVCGSAMVLQIISERQSGFSVPPHAFVGAARQLCRNVSVEHSLRVCFGRLRSIFGLVTLRVIHDLRHRYENFAAKKADGLKMLFDIRLF